MRDRFWCYWDARLPHNCRDWKTTSTFFLPPLGRQIHLDSARYVILQVKKGEVSVEGLSFVLGFPWWPECVWCVSQSTLRPFGDW